MVVTVEVIDAVQRTLEQDGLLQVLKCLFEKCFDCGNSIFVFLIVY
jgi:hypothetical protein